MSRRIYSAVDSLGKHKVLGLSVSAALSLLGTSEAHAACISVGSSATVVGSTGCVNWSGGNMTLTSNGTLTSATSAALTASGLAGTLTNSGLLHGTSVPAFENTASSLVVINNTNIIGGTAGILNSGSIISLTNNAGGTITGVTAGITNAGSIASLVNSGTLSSSGSAILNESGGTFGSITNSGVIAGAITNLSATDLTINGGSGSVFGILTGSTGSVDSASMGIISSGAANLNFNAGNLLLNDNLNVGSYTVNNSGATLQINNHVNITGNYAQGASATLLVGVGDSAVSNGVVSDTGYGRLVVSGAATIASGSSVSLKALNSYGFALGQRFVVVQAATNGTQYNASSLVYSASGYNGPFTGSTLIDGNTSNLLVTLGTDSSVSPLLQATTPNAISAISGLFRYTGTDASLLNVFNASAALGSAGEANRAGAQLSPTWSAMAASQASAAPTRQVINVASARLDGLRTAQAQGGSGVATGEGISDTALWVQAFGGKAAEDERDSVSGYSANYTGLLFGGDHQINDAWRVGGMFSYANTSVDGKDDNSGSSVNVKSYGLLPYASYTTDDWYLNLLGGVVQHQYDTKRLINFTGVNGVANGDYDGLQWVVSTQAGYPVRLNERTVLTPIAGLNYSRLKQDSYRESGGGGAALSVASSKSYSLTSDLGAKLERSYDSSHGRFEPSVQLTWRHEYRDTRLRSTANYAIDTSGSTSFTSIGSAPISDTGIMALAATFTSKDNLEVAAKYTIEAASGYMAQTAELRMRYQF